MFIQFVLQQNSQDPIIVKFPINTNGLVTAIKTSYLNLGTSYDPIRADNFINLDNYEFPSIDKNTKISISLENENIEESFNFIIGKLICSKIKNVGKEFNNLIDPPKNYWDKIFNLKGAHIHSTPDNFLYVSPDNNGICSISTKKNAIDAYISYSIIFSISLTGGERPYYYILDPVVHVRSKGPKEY